MLSHRRRLSFVVSLAVAMAGTACVMDVSTRSEARAEISGPDGTPVQVVTSTRFVGDRESSPPAFPDTTETSLRPITADTSRRTLPDTVTRSLTETQMFYIRVVLVDSAEVSADGPVNATMRLLIDGEEHGQVENDLVQSALQIAFSSSFMTG